MKSLENSKELVIINDFARKLDRGHKQIFYDIIAPMLLELGEMYGKTYSEKESSSEKLIDYFKNKSRE
ncbi:MAG: hypothetical protein KKF67_01295 [Nanoarchaeota archaeon]|nr:hypothetical protein [Nanoarchaeota archaeon]